MDLAKFRWIVVWVALLVGCLGFSRSVHAATGTMYLTPATSNLGNGAETVLALRISPGTPINGVQAEIGYDPAKLQLVSVGDEGTAFPEIAEQNSGANPVTLTRTTTGSTVSGDSLIITLRFKALTTSGSTTISVAGNAAQGTSATEPSTQGATITFGTPSSPQSPANPAPSSPQNPGGGGTNPQNPTPQQPEGTEGMPSTDEHTAEEHTADTNHQAVTAQTLTRRFWWAGIPLVIILIAAGYWLVRHRQTRLAIRATEHRIDATWATPNTVAQEDPRTNELLEHSHGINTPDPGSVIAPGVNKENEDDKK